MYISYQYFKWWINCKWRRRQRKSAPNTVMHENLMFTLYNLCGKPSNDQTLQVIEQRGALILGYFLVCCLSVLIDLSLDCLHRNLTLIHAVVVGFSHVIRLKLHESFLRDSLLSYGQREEWSWLYLAIFCMTSPHHCGWGGIVEHQRSAHQLWLRSKAMGSNFERNKLSLSNHFHFVNQA